MKKSENTLVDAATVTNSTACRAQASYRNVERYSVRQGAEAMETRAYLPSLGAFKCRTSPLPVQFGLLVTSLSPQTPSFLALSLGGMLVVTG